MVREVDDFRGHYLGIVARNEDNEGERDENIDDFLVHEGVHVVKDQIDLKVLIVDCENNCTHSELIDTTVPLARVKDPRPKHFLEDRELKGKVENEDNRHYFLVSTTSVRERKGKITKGGEQKL